MIHALAPKSLNTWGCFPRPPATVAFMEVCILGRDLRKICGHPGGGIYTPSKWWHYVTCHESTGQGLHIHPWIFQAFMLHCLSQLGGPLQQKFIEPWTPYGLQKPLLFVKFWWVYVHCPPQKKERLPHLTASWQLPWHTNSYKPVFSRRQVTSSRRQGPHHVTVESDQKGPRKNEWILKQLHGNRDISRNPVTPFKGPLANQNNQTIRVCIVQPMFLQKGHFGFSAHHLQKISPKQCLNPSLGNCQFAFATIP